VLLARKGFAVTSVGSLQEARVEAARLKPAHAVVDMRLEDGNGLDLVAELRAMSPDVRVVMLTGYGNLATAVAAVKAGAIDYLAKPADPEDFVRALSADGGARPEAPPEPMSADRVRWEHIQRVYELCDRNVSETARRLKMHRRTLQRILAKRSPK
jgi:two-component system response regulator RegA